MSELPETVRIDPVQALAGRVDLPGDKSVSHRALLLSAYAEGSSSIKGLSTGDDVRATAAIVAALGAGVEIDGSTVRVVGGRDHLRAAPLPLDCGNSGTAMRLLMGFVAGIPGHHFLVGDSSLSSRPMDRVAEPLERMGAKVRGTGERLVAPVVVEGGQLRGITYSVPVPSAQVKSAILLAGLRADSHTTVLEAVATRPNTEEMIAQAGGTIKVERTSETSAITVEPGRLEPVEWQVPQDPSQAAFFIVAGLLAKNGEVRCHHLYADQTRTGFLKVLERMGASMQTKVDDTQHLAVTALPSELRGTTVSADEIPSLDEVPILAIAAAAADGETRFSDVAELRIKESDRFALTIDLVSRLGSSAHAEGDDLVIIGRPSATFFQPLTFDARQDHRMAMAAAVAGLVGQGATINGFATVASSFPTFLDVVDAVS